jgi:hypothetical protein
MSDDTPNPVPDPPQPLAGEVVELEAHIEIPMGLLTERISAAAEARERDATRDVRVLRERPTAREAERVESTMMAGLDGLAVKLRVPFDPDAPLQLQFLPEMFLVAIAQKAKTTHNVIVKKACVDFLEAAASYASRMIVELDRRRITMEAQRTELEATADAETPDTEEPKS